MPDLAGFVHPAPPLNLNVVSGNLYHFRVATYNIMQLMAVYLAIVIGRKCALLTPNMGGSLMDATKKK